MKNDLQRNNAAPRARHFVARKAPSKENSSPLSLAMKNSVIGFLWSLPICVLLIFVSALVALRSKDPAALITPLAIASLMIPSLICGFLSGKLNGRSYLLCSATSGVLMAALVTVLSLLMGRTAGVEHFAASERAIIYLALLLMSTVGGFLSSLGNKSSRKRKRK